MAHTKNDSFLFWFAVVIGSIGFVSVIILAVHTITKILNP